jgi:hypothetical protein
MIVTGPALQIGFEAASDARMDLDFMITLGLDRQGWRMEAT